MMRTPSTRWLMVKLGLIEIHERLIREWFTFSCANEELVVFLAAKLSL